MNDNPVSKSPVEIVRKDPRLTRLANDFSDVIARALRQGFKSDEACCVAVQVAADYARAEYGPGYLANLAAIVIAAGDRPMPQSADTLPSGSRAQH